MPFARSQARTVKGAPVRYTGVRQANKGVDSGSVSGTVTECGTVSADVPDPFAGLSVLDS